MLKKSIVSAAIFSLASLSSVVNAQDGLDFDVTSAGKAVSEASLKTISAKDEYVTNENGRKNEYTQTTGRNLVTIKTADNAGHSGSAEYFITRNHR